MCEVGFVYRWTDSSNGMYYIGSHKGCPDDEYVGSGVYFSRAYSVRPESFTREIIYSGVDYRELEEFILQEVDAANDPMSYNLKNSAIGGYMGKDGVRKMIEKVKGVKKSKEACLNISKGKVRYSVYCSLNQKKYKTSMEAAIDLNISTSYVRGMVNGQFNNKYQLSKIEKIT